MGGSVGYYWTAVAASSTSHQDGTVTRLLELATRALALSSAACSRVTCVGGDRVAPMVSE